MPNIRSILVPVDFSPSSRLALEHARFLSDRMGAALHVLHAWEVPAYLRPDLTVWSGEVSATLAEHAGTEAERAMKEFLADARVADHPRVTWEAVSGAPYATILTALQTGAFDFVAMGTHGRTGLAHLVLGSVAEKVVRHATVPVLTIRAPRAKETTA